jgi:hypothetical protein
MRLSNLQLQQQQTTRLQIFNLNSSSKAYGNEIHIAIKSPAAAAAAAAAEELQKLQHRQGLKLTICKNAPPRFCKAEPFIISYMTDLAGTLNGFLDQIQPD